jgi:hypothetical protein
MKRASSRAELAYRHWLQDYAARLNEQADRLAAMALRGQDTLALAAALDARLTAGQAVEVARELVALRE